jgi:lathosterol oxidase
VEALSAIAHHAGVYVWYYAGACARFFGVAGAMYLLSHVWFRERWTSYRIQKALPEAGSVSHEIRASLRAIACSGLASVLLYELIARGHTRMYFDLDAHGLGYLALSAALGIVGYDTWFYWQHRMLHTPWWFRHAHAVHHQSTNPTPFANFAHSWVEISVGNVYFIGLVLLVPMHPIAFGLVSMFIFGWGMLTHSGYEVFPRWFASHRAFGWINSGTHHNMHHSQQACNYGMFFNFWDRCMGTNHPRYRETFAAVRAGLPERAMSPLGVTEG